MPVRLVVGRTKEPATKAVSAEPVLEMSQASLEPFWEQEIPGLYGLDPLARVAASLELKGTLPSPLSPGTIEWDLLFEAYDEDLVQFPTVIFSPAGVFVPPSYSEPLEEEAGSLLDLKEETERILQHLSGPANLALALRDIGVEPFGLEWFTGQALLQACEIGLGINLPLTYKWRYPVKDPKAPLSYHNASSWGLGDIAEVSIRENGKEVHVRLLGGYVYRLPVEYAQTWNLDAAPTSGAVAVKCRVDPHAQYFEMELDTREVLDISVVSLLAGCEPMYEHFGGWTPEAEENVRRGFEKYGPFRLEPL